MSRSPTEISTQSGGGGGGRGAAVVEWDAAVEVCANGCSGGGKVRKKIKGVEGIMGYGIF